VLRDLFLARNQGYTQLNMPGADGTYPAGINNVGVIVGDYYDQSEGQYIGFVLNAGHYISISIPGAISTCPTGINSKGDIAGYSWDDQVVSHGFVFKSAIRAE
jgi:probable HAF family extracellular repeat protein